MKNATSTEGAKKRKPPKKLHKTRFSDSSVYDEVCIYCGATDARGDPRLEKPCPGKRQ